MKSESGFSFAMASQPFQNNPVRQKGLYWKTTKAF